MWFLSSPVPSSAKPGRSILSSPVQVWASLPGASCPLPGAKSQLLGWLPSSHCPRAPRLLSGQAKPCHWGLVQAQSGSHGIGTPQRACAQVTASPQLVLGRASTETQGSFCRKSIYDSVLHHWRFVSFADILDTSRVISEDGKKKVGAVCKAHLILAQ